MIGLGSIVNAAAIVAGGCVGLVAGKAISERVRVTLVSGMAVGTLFVGASSTFSKMLSVGDGGAVEMVPVDDALICRGEEIERYGLKAMDAIHVACAEAASCDWFLTTDRGTTKKLHVIGGMRIANPVDFVMED